MSTQAVNPEITIPQSANEKLETRAKHAEREADGKWASGYCPNPNGRPKSQRIKEALEGILHDEGAERYAQVVTGIALSKKQRAADRLAAVNIIADRTEGKPLQAMLVGHTVDESSVRAIAELLGKMNTPPILEADNE